MGRLRSTLAFLALLSGVTAAGEASAVCRLRAPDSVAVQEVTEQGRRANYRASSAKLQVGGNVTDIVRFRNRSSCPVRVFKRDTKFLQPDEEAVDLVPGGELSSSMWVPWSEENDRDRMMWIEFDGQRYFAVWQRHNRIHFTAAPLLERARTRDEMRRLIESAPEVPGLALKGGQRVLHLAVSPGGAPYFYFEGVPQ